MAKKYEIDDKIYYFNYERFNELFSKVKGQKPVGVIEQELADFLHVSKSAVHNWKCRKQSPNDLELIKDIAKFFELRNHETLLMVKGDINNMNNFSDLQINSIKRIYDSIIEHLDYFEKTDGYNDLWNYFYEKGINPKYIKDNIYEVAEKELYKIIICYKKERMLLKNTEVYTEIGNYIYNDLYDIFDGKLDYGYRFEAIVDGNPTTYEDYNKAIDNINTIIDKYV